MGVKNLLNLVNVVYECPHRAFLLQGEILEKAKWMHLKKNERGWERNLEVRGDDIATTVGILYWPQT